MLGSVLQNQGERLFGRFPDHVRDLPVGFLQRPGRFSAQNSFIIIIQQLLSPVQNRIPLPFIENQTVHMGRQRRDEPAVPVHMLLRKRQANHPRLDGESFAASFFRCTLRFSVSHGIFQMMIAKLELHTRAFIHFLLFLAFIFIHSFLIPGKAMVAKRI